MKRVVVISDLHLGGEWPDPNQGSRGFRMCTQTNALAFFIKSLAEEKTRTELVINGDFLDFLAEEWDEGVWLPVIDDPGRAAARLERMMSRDRDVFDALSYFLESGHALTVLLGNHDVELSYPQVRRALCDAIGATARNFRFVYDGEAYVVGKVLIEHGNRYDPWNVVDHDALRRTRSAQSRSEPLDEPRRFAPPAGSQMVSSVMNRIKKRYQFVDLLKPEREATLIMLLALAPEYANQLGLVAMLAYKSRAHALDDKGVHKFAGDISGPSPASPSHAIRRALAARLGTAEASAFARGIEAASPPEPAGMADEIAFGGAAKSTPAFPLPEDARRTPLSKRMPALLTALRAFRNEKCFDPLAEAEEYLVPARRLLDRGFQVVVFGHTHLAKRIELEHGVYLNTGTWADLIRFPYERLDDTDPAALRWLESFAADLEQGNVARHIVHKPTYAMIDLADDGSVIRSELHEYEGSTS